MKSILRPFSDRISGRVTEQRDLRDGLKMICRHFILDKNRNKKETLGNPIGQSSYYNLNNKLFFLRSVKFSSEAIQIAESRIFKVFCNNT